MNDQAKATAEEVSTVLTGMLQPVHVKTTAVYDIIVDAEGRLIAFVTICENSKKRAAAIVTALNRCAA